MNDLQGYILHRQSENGAWRYAKMEPADHGGWYKALDVHAMIAGLEAERDEAVALLRRAVCVTDVVSLKVTQDIDAFLYRHDER